MNSAVRKKNAQRPCNNIPKSYNMDIILTVYRQYMVDFLVSSKQADV